MPLYFAYGSNMDVAGMAQRCPGAKPLGVARLARHRFALMAEGYATIARDPRAEVWGVLWSLSLADVRPLDAYEDVASGLYSKAIQPVIKLAGGSAQALVYIGRVTRGPVRQRAEAAYLENVVRAGLAWNLPDAYLRGMAAMGAKSLKDIIASEPLPVPAPRPKVQARFATPHDR